MRSMHPNVRYYDREGTKGSRADKSSPSSNPPGTFVDAKRSGLANSIIIRRRFFHSAAMVPGPRRTSFVQPAMIMSDKIKPDAAVSDGPSGQPVPDWLGNRLRRMFTEVMDEPVPDEFKALLKQLEDKEKERGS